MMKIENLLDELPKVRGFSCGAPATDEAIAFLEQELGVVFPGSYKAFLKRHGWVSSQYRMEVIGTGIQGNALDTTGSIADFTQEYRDEWRLPNNLIVIQPDEEDYCPHCFDVSRADEAGEYEVVYFEPAHDYYEKTCANFEEWLEKFVLRVGTSEET